VTSAAIEASAIALGTENGFVHVLGLDGHVLKSSKVHDRAVNSVSVDSSGSAVARCAGFSVISSQVRVALTPAPPLPPLRQLLGQRVGGRHVDRPRHGREGRRRQQRRGAVQPAPQVRVHRGRRQRQDPQVLHRRRRDGATHLPPHRVVRAEEGGAVQRRRLAGDRHRVAGQRGGVG
jgi:hypothetical protein